MLLLQDEILRANERNECDGQMDKVVAWRFAQYGVTFGKYEYL
jgi:hypothetical protein